MIIYDTQFMITCLKLYNSPASPNKSNEKSQGRETAPRWDASLLRSILPDFAHKLPNFSAILTSFIPEKSSISGQPSIPEVGVLESSTACYGPKLYRDEVSLYIYLYLPTKSINRQNVLESPYTSNLDA